MLFGSSSLNQVPQQLGLYQEGRFFSVYWVYGGAGLYVFLLMLFAPDL